MTIAEFNDLQDGDLIMVSSGRIYKTRWYLGYPRPDFVQQRDGKDYGPHRILKPSSIVKVIS